MSIEHTDAESAAVATHPRVTLADIKSSINAEYYTTAAAAVGKDVPICAGMDAMTVCFLVMKNGFIVIGKSAPASPENFNAELGRKLAYEDAVRQLWPLMGFALRDKLKM